MAPRKSAAASASASASMAAAEEPSAATAGSMDEGSAGAAGEAASGVPKALATRIDVLQEHGINAADTKKLREAGICTVEALQQATKKEILEVKGITEARLGALVDAAAKVSVLHSGKFKTATQLKEEQATLFHVSTGSKEFDALLGGGMQSKFLTEVYGEYRTGKSQLCATLAVTAQLNATNGGKVVFVDTEGNFSPDRLRPICERFNVSLESVLENILVARVFNTDQQEAVPQMIEAQIDADGGAPYSLIVIDSLTSLWRVDFSGRGELSERQQKLGRHLNQLRKLAERHNLAVVYTNQVMSDPAGGMTFVPDPKKPVGGHVVAHASNVRVSLRKGRDQERVAKLVDHPSSSSLFSLRFVALHDAVHHETTDD